MSDNTTRILFVLRDDLGQPIDPPRALILGREPKLIPMTEDRNGWILEVTDE